METQIAHDIPAESRGSARAHVVASLGPMTVAAGIIWALLQPYRLTILDPGGQSFWWLVAEPQLLVILVGTLFHFLVVPGLLEDLERGP